MDDNTLLVGVASLVCLLIGTLVFVKFSKPPTVLPQADFKKYPLIKKENLSHDTRKFTFGLPKGSVLGLPTGQHISLRFVGADGKPVLRSYTPVSDNSTIGEFSVVIKVYKAGVNEKFPEGGKMSQYLDALKIGDVIDMKGPKGHMEYKKGGKFSVKPLGKPMESRQTNQIIMIAGGTGITPMLQILHFIFENPGDPNIKVKMLYANQSKLLSVVSVAEESRICCDSLKLIDFVFRQPRTIFWSDQSSRLWQHNFLNDFRFIIHWTDLLPDGNIHRDLSTRKCSKNTVCSTIHAKIRKSSCAGHHPCSNSLVYPT